jgi:hypothetical protein
MIEKYYKKIWKHNKKWANPYYSDKDVIHSKYSDMFVYERIINLVKDFFLNVPVKELLGQDFCNLLWNFVELYEEIKDERLNEGNFVYEGNIYAGSLKSDYKEYYKSVLIKLYDSPQFNAIVDFMKGNNIPYLYTPLNNWEDYNSFKNPDYHTSYWSKIESYVNLYSVDLICINYVRIKLLIANKEKINNAKRELFNSIMKKHSLNAEDKDYEEYLAWDANKACHLGSINRYKKMSIYAVMMS